MKAGDIVLYGKEHQFIGVVMEVTTSSLFVQDEGEQYEIPISEAVKATAEDMAEELRMIYHYYH